MIILVCDLCGKPLKPGDGTSFKVKEYGKHWDSGWKVIDAHSECVKKLLANVKDEEEVKQDLEGGK